ncbi:hypothetical protein GCM10009557_69930 [Virgisporangium ochraceum]|uniref:Uncharacterized protein n=1 Tax=Virgisporangium ochraceum TaxID=65505 RepID=A0A8J3ZV60_9ACTN|nr:hypothetical protein [Virgisporangium ochraceum]GIJ70529.1 hypothetical protein Voc01_054460 [Virgisporangium ochraceum]
MRALQRMADGLLGMFVPKVEASAIYYWQNFCQPYACSSGGGSQRIRCYCHDSGGGCTSCYNNGCC